jgi:hypothetical protein
MALKGFSVPLSPEGRATLTPLPPWYYSGDVLVVDFEASPEAVAAVLPPLLEPDSADPGGCTAFFADWQYASETGEERLDPVRAQYREFILLVNASYAGGPVCTCPYIWVDKDSSMARGWIQGWPKKLAEVCITRAAALRSPAAPIVEPGALFAGTLAANGRRLAEATVILDRISQDPVYLGSRTILNVRHFPQLAGGSSAKPSVHELVRSILSGAQRTDVWEGSATLDFFPAPDQELDVFQPRRIRRGFRYSAAFRVDDLEVVAKLV